jgi:methylmalonyl-CoA carboxyltransferase small subunit
VKLRITVEGKTYDVDVQILEEQVIASEPPENGVFRSVFKVPPPSDEFPGDRICRSPIAGVITAVMAVAGQTVAEGDPVFIIEAMKMETKIGAPVSGIVKAVHVAPGDAVRSDQVLLELA